MLYVTWLQGDVLSPEEWAAVEQLGILVDQDDQGVLLQIFTKPLGDRWALTWQFFSCYCG